jgi:DNA-binding MarR family transcriptional regulator
MTTLQELGIRPTYRTLRVLTAIAEHPGSSNREVADSAGVLDEGQISKLLKRLESLGLIENTGEGQAEGKANAWRLTAEGEEVLRGWG